MCIKRKPRVSEATRSREQAERDLAATRAETPKYRALAESLRELRQENQFRDRIASIYRGAPDGR